MTLEWEQVCIDARDPVALGQWWAEALGWVVINDDADEFEIDLALTGCPGCSSGRAHTDTTTFSVPWDHGCHWLHSASVSPMRELADHYGFNYLKNVPPQQIWLDGRWMTAEEIATLDQQFDDLYSDVHAVGIEGQDVSIASVTNPSHPAYAAFVRAIHAEWGHDLDQVSTLDAARYRDTVENWPLKNGYGSLVAHHHRNTPVELLDTGHADRLARAASQSHDQQRNC